MDCYQRDGEKAECLWKLMTVKSVTGQLQAEDEQIMNKLS